MNAFGFNTLDSIMSVILIAGLGISFGALLGFVKLILYVFIERQPHSQVQLQKGGEKI